MQTVKCAQCSAPVSKCYAEISNGLCVGCAMRLRMDERNRLAGKRSEQDRTDDPYDTDDPAPM